MEDDTLYIVVNQTLKKEIEFSITEQVNERKNEIRPISSSVADSSGRQDEAWLNLRNLSIWIFILTLWK